MKKFYSFLFAAVALVGFAACNQDFTENVAPENGEMVSFKATIADETRVGLDGLKTVWKAGDKVMINDYEFICQNDLETFVCKQQGCSELLSEDYGEVTAVYASQFDASNVGVVDSTKGSAGALLEATGSLRAGSLSFKIKSAFLKFTTTSEKVSLKCEGGAIFSHSPINVDDLTPEDGVYYVAIEPGTVTLYYEVDGVQVKRIENKTFEAGKVYNLGFLCAPSDWEISDGTRFYTTETTDLFVAKNVKLTANNFCLHKVGDTAWGAGAKYGLVTGGTKTENTAIGLYSANWSNDITISNATTTAHDIYFDKANSRLYVMTVGKHPSTVSEPTNANWYNIAGTMNNWGSNIDGYKFTYSGDNVWHLVIDFKANDEFKVQLKNNWDNPNYGHYQIQSGVGRGLSNGSDNAKIKAAGTYEIWVLPTHSDAPLYILKK